MNSNVPGRVVQPRQVVEGPVRIKKDKAQLQIAKESAAQSTEKNLPKQGKQNAREGRKRKQPSDYWVMNPVEPAIASPVAENPQSIPSSKDRKIKGMHDAPKAGNRGRPVKKSKRIDQNRDNTEDEATKAKAVRRGRSSGTTTELERSSEAVKAIRELGAKKTFKAAANARHAGTSIGSTQEKPIDSTDLTSSNNATRGSKRRRSSEDEAQASVVRDIQMPEERPGRKRISTKLTTRLNTKNTASQAREPSVESQTVTASSKFGKSRGRPRKHPEPVTSQSKVYRSSRKVQDAEESIKPNRQPRISTKTSTSASRQHANGPRKPASGHVPVQEMLKNQPRKRHRVEETAQDDQDDADELDVHTPYPYLKPTIRNVSLQVIDANWDPLPQSSIDQISVLLKEIQKPVTARIRNDRRWNQANTAVNSIVQRVLRKLSKHQMPFPQASFRTREDDFDFEKVFDQNRSLRDQVTPVIHANDLLEDELRKELARLESDRQNLSDLEANAKSEAMLRSEATRTLHSLLQVEPLLQDGKLKDDIGLRDKPAHASLDLTVS